MKCHLCESEAVARCYTCGGLVCEQHGKSDSCAGCTTGIASGDPRGDRIRVKPNLLAQNHQQNHGWWRPQQAEEYSPPACYECKGLTRTVCRHCRCYYCREHAGRKGLCQACDRSSWFGLITLGTIAILVLLICLSNWLLAAYRLIP